MEGGYGARVYDAVYRWKDYGGEAAKLQVLLGRAGGTLLDVACGTGNHLVRLRDSYQVDGLERDPEMAEIARAKGVSVHVGDMEYFDLDRHFDIVTCLFSSIGYMETPERMVRAVSCMAAHLSPGGVLVVEPWFAPDQWRDGFLHMDTVDDEDLKITRMSVSKTDGPVSVLDLHHMVATPEGIETFVTHHRMGLFADWEYRDAFSLAGLTVERDEEGLMGRGLYIGTRS